MVDSGSSDGSPEMVAAEFPQVTLIASPINLGYAKGNNLGMATTTGRYALLLNPDTVLAVNSLSLMVEYLESQPDVGALGPQLLWPDRTLQSSRRSFPTIGTLFWESTLLGQWFPSNRHVQQYHLAHRAADTAQAVDWVVGAAIMVRQTTWQQVGPIDENFFMYFEETDWCHRCVEAGWPIHYLPTAQIVHYEGKSSEQVVAARTIRFQRSKIHYAGKHFGPAWAFALRLFLWLTFAIQLMEETLKWLVGHRRALRWSRMVAYSQVLRSI